MSKNLDEREAFLGRLPEGPYGERMRAIFNNLSAGRTDRIRKFVLSAVNEDPWILPDLKIKLLEAICIIKPSDGDLEVLKGIFHDATECVEDSLPPHSEPDPSNEEVSFRLILIQLISSALASQKTRSAGLGLNFGRGPS